MKLFQMQRGQPRAIVLKPGEEIMKVVWLKQNLYGQYRFTVQVIKNGQIVGGGKFITKEAAMDWIDLNAKGLEVKDITWEGTKKPRPMV